MIDPLKSLPVITFDSPLGREYKLAGLKTHGKAPLSHSMIRRHGTRIAAFFLAVADFRDRGYAPVPEVFCAPRRKPLSLPVITFDSPLGREYKLAGLKTHGKAPLSHSMIRRHGTRIAAFFTVDTSGS